MKATLPRTNIIRRPRPYSKPEYLLKMYYFMEKFQQENKFGVSIQDLRDAGFSPSTSVVRYYLGRMQEFRMIHQPIGKRLDGTEFTPARSIVLLPLSGAHLIIREILEKESDVEGTELSDEPHAQIATEL